MHDLGITCFATCWQSAAYIWNVVLRCECSLVIGHIKRYFLRAMVAPETLVFCVSIDTQAGLAIKVWCHALYLSDK